MTISGGPDQSFADPGTRSDRTDDPVVLDRDPGRLDGDDITVEPDTARRDPGRRFLVAAIVLVLAAAAIGTAVALSHRSSSAKSGAASVRTVQPTPPPAHPAPGKSPVAGTPGKGHAPAPAATIATPPNAVTPATNPSSVAIPPPVDATLPPQAVTPPPPPPVTTPPAEPASVLQWTAKPASVSVKGGARTDIVVTVVNPTNGTVSLPVPLSCAPTLRGPHGAYFGQSMCEQLAQLLSPHQKLTQHYTIYATTTGDPSGQPLAPGMYTAGIENLFNMKVTVTAS